MEEGNTLYVRLPKFVERRSIADLAKLLRRPVVVYQCGEVCCAAITEREYYTLVRGRYYSVEVCEAALVPLGSY